MWLISHASGTIGRALVQAASKRGHRVRALVLDPSHAGSLGSEAELVVAGVSDTAAHERAFDKVEAAVITAPLGSDFVPWHRALCTAAEAAGVKRVVQMSGQGADLKSPTRILRWLADAEGQALNAGLHPTVLRPSLYMQMLFKHIPEISSCGVIEAPFRSARWALVDARDVADVAVERLESGAKPSVRELTGPQALDYFEIARVVSKVTGRRIHYVDVCSPKARGRLEARRVSPRLIEALIEYWDFHAASPTGPRITQEIENLLGRPPRKFSEFVKDYREEFGGTCIGAMAWLLRRT